MITERLKQLTGSATSGMRNRARKLRENGIHVMNFAAGELDHDTAGSVKDAVRAALDSNNTRYTDTLGIAPLREKLAEKITQKTTVHYTAEEVGFTAGAKQALFGAAMAVFQAGDEVIIPSPYWVTFPEQIRLAGATPVFLETKHHGFQLNADELARCITPRTKGIILNTPHNPTGVVYPPLVLKKVAALVMLHDLVCVFDECYDELTYAPASHQHIVKLVPAMKERTILIGSLSKSYCMAGWRAGYFAAPKSIVKAIANLQSHVASNPSNLTQFAALAALESTNDAFVTSNLNQLTAQRRTALELIGKIAGVSCVMPDGAFYLFPDVSQLLVKSFDGETIGNVDRLAELLLEHAHIAVVPGTAFGADQHIRISYAIPASDIETGLTRFAQFVHQLS